MTTINNDSNELGKVRKTTDELRELAFGAVAGTIFTSQHVPPNVAPDLVPRVFMSLLLMGEEDRKNLEQEEPALFYESMSKAQPWAVNGYPRFGTVKWLNHGEFDEYSKYVNQLLAFKKGVSDESNN